MWFHWTCIGARTTREFDYSSLKKRGVVLNTRCCNTRAIAIGKAIPNGIVYRSVKIAPGFPLYEGDNSSKLTTPSKKGLARVPFFSFRSASMSISSIKRPDRQAAGRHKRRLPLPEIRNALSLSSPRSRKIFQYSSRTSRLSRLPVNTAFRQWRTKWYLHQ